MILSLLMILGCGAKLPIELSQPDQNPHPSCNPNTHIWATGIGDSPQGAINNAKTSVSSQIKSDLVSSTKQSSQTFKTTTSDGRYSTNLIQFEKNLLNTIETNTAFEHAELIEIVVSPQEYKNQFHTLTCLNKSKTGKVLMDELSPLMDSFTKTAELALSFVNESADPQEHSYAKFTSQFAQAARLRKEILPKLYLIRSITGRQDATATAFENMWKQLVFKGKNIISQTTVGLELSSLDLPEEEQLLIQEVIRGSLSEHGLRVVSNDTCGKGITHVAKTVVREHCKPPSQTFGAGHMCKPIVTVTITECSTELASTV